MKDAYGVKLFLSLIILPYQSLNNRTNHRKRFDWSSFNVKWHSSVQLSCNQQKSEEGLMTVFHLEKLWSTTPAFTLTPEVVVGSGHTCCFRLIFVDVPRRRASDPIRNYHVNLPRLQGHVLLASNILRARYCSSSCAYQSFFFLASKAS